tara:strand:- start:3094 stop:4170 length:1077 start_codon:yes stop_codon:yes gene_type:complete
MYGIGYSGSLAYIGAISTFLAVLINLRWDIEIMVNKSQRLSLCLSDASMTIIFMTFMISLLNVVFGSPIQIYIILSALAIAIHELLVSVLFIQKKIYVYSFFRTIPAISLIFFALIGFEPEMIWPASFFLSVFFLVIYFRNLFKRAIYNMSLNRIKKIKLINKINAAITATTFSFFSALFVIIIDYYYGDDYVGLWANTIRIFNSVIVFLLAACLPFVLKMLKDQELISKKIKIFYYLWAAFLPLIVLSFIVVSNWGIYIFSVFQSFDIDVTNADMSIIFLISVVISFIGSSQGLYQATNKSIILLLMVITTAFFGMIIIYNSSFSFTSLIELFLFLVLFLMCMILVHLTYNFIYKIK